MNRRALALLAAGHFLTDLCQGTVPALLPFLVMERHFSYTAAASLVFAISASSSVVQPLFGQVADRLALAWLLPVSILLQRFTLVLHTVRHVGTSRGCPGVSRAAAPRPRHHRASSSSSPRLDGDLA